jgi:uncharacterized protein YbjT (DUF2867 family)
MSRILITGASGHVGRHIVSQLLAANAPIRALSRNPHSAGLPPEVEVMSGDLTLPATLDECLAGVDSVFLVWTAPPAAVRPALERIAKHARRIVFLSSPYQTAHPFFQRPQPNPISSLHAEIERLIKASDLAWTFLRPGIFAANAAPWWSTQIRAGDVVRWPYARALTAPIDERDIAAVAVRALCDNTCVGSEYVLTGPESLSHLDQVSTLGDVLGRALSFEEVTPEDWRRELPPSWPASIANMLLDAWAAAIDEPALVTSAVAEITGRPPRTFHDWALDNAAQFQ